MNCSSARPFQLTDVSPKFKDFQGTDLDPYVEKKESIILTNKPKYDEHILNAKRSISTLEFAEKVSLKAELKKFEGQDIKAEMSAAAYLEEDLPPVIANLGNLKKNNIELMDDAPNDFDGPSIGKASGVLEGIREDLNLYIPKANKILQSIKSIRSDSSNYTEKKETPKEVVIVPEIIKDPEIKVVEEKPKPKDKFGKRDIKDVSVPKEKIQINRVPKKNKVTGSAKELIAEQVSKEDANLTDDEKKEKEYTEKIRKGLVEVFTYEYYKKGKGLEKLLISHPIPRIRSAAALALGRIKAGRVTLQQAIDKDGYQVRPAAYKALSDIGDKRSLSYFFSGTKAEDPEVIAVSFEGLGKTKDPAGRELILNQGLSSEYVIIVAGSLRGLAYHKIPADVEIIEKFIRSEDKEIKEAAIEALSIHGSRESLRILEQNVKEQPDLALKILDEIGKNPSLSATFSLIRLNESIQDENLTKRIGEHLLRRKAFGKYAIILIEDDFIRTEPNERSKPLSYIKAKEVGLVLGETKKEYSVRIGEDIITDKYIQIKIESTLPGSSSQFVTGWVFYPKLEIIEVKKLGGNNSKGKYSNYNTGKHQNLFNPTETDKAEIPSEE
ncbi:HEAT repeat domain-containing protein [Leptospira sp. 'Mane']|uniref:HEAT repeat domain-containing protein n=1 Tax=Leptospira sp. 'Mane' TaxID=3387407 RepID=UPI00398A6475